MTILNAPKQKSGHRSDDGLIPMINIIFLLLVFFMIAGTIAQHEQGMKLPFSNSENELAPERVEIMIDAQKIVHVNGEPVVGELQFVLQTLQVSEHSTVICKINQSLPAEVLDPVMRAVQALGIGKLQLATELQR